MSESYRGDEFPGELPDGYRLIEDTSFEVWVKKFFHVIYYEEDNAHNPEESPLSIPDNIELGEN